MDRVRSVINSDQTSGTILYEMGSKTRFNGNPDRQTNGGGSTWVEKERDRLTVVRNLRRGVIGTSRIDGLVFVAWAIYHQEGCWRNGVTRHPDQEEKGCRFPIVGCQVTRRNLAIYSSLLASGHYRGAIFWNNSVVLGARQRLTRGP